MLESFVRNWVFVVENFETLEGVTGVAHGASDLENIGIWEGMLGVTKLRWLIENETRTPLISSTLDFRMAAQVDDFDALIDPGGGGFEMREE
jgi:hypothetical protein